VVLRRVANADLFTFPKGGEIMEYRKPELMPVGQAQDMIESSLTKGPYPFDQMGGPTELTNVSAYQADE
jgi:hypothetical protein